MADALTPNDIARETLRALAARRLPATPDNYRTVYAEIAGPRAAVPVAGEQLLAVVRPLATRHRNDLDLAMLLRSLERGDAEAVLVALNAVVSRSVRTGRQELGPVFQEVLRQLDTPHRGWTIARKRESLDRMLAGTRQNEVLATRLLNLLRTWQEAGGGGAVGALGAPRPEPARAGGSSVVTMGAPDAERLRELLLLALDTGLAPRLERHVDLHSELFHLLWRVRDAAGADDWDRFGRQLRQFLRKVELTVEPDEELVTNLARLLAMVVDNLGELVEDDQWVAGQVATLRDLVSGPIELRAVREAERGLRELIFRQSQLKASLRDAKAALKSLLAMFVERLAQIAGATVEYQGRIERYGQLIAGTENLGSLRAIVEELLDDTRGLQVDMLRSRDELVLARREAEDTGRRVQELEGALAQASERLREDPVTGALNRRGLEEALAREIARSERTGRPVTVVLIEPADIARIEGAEGPEVAEAGLLHIVRVMKRTLRPTDIIARFGIDGFLLALPDTDLDNAAVVAARLQLELARRAFAHGGELTALSFSGALAQHTPGELAEGLLGRADLAALDARRQGRNAVSRAP
jgi:diguanylate cyclase